ncbi:hypothetical protein [Sphingobacterium sp. FBM7-1]|uniref:hypothetical protein n=1 Tax=Sphingobacterium sp. FBM7-1 TaxID=2886688 RepID=UPI001D12F035|nr:hypothetical protein [Sphingobacterium sp. FBM7-1]MCC2598887.1 hypothetical protein [Sphingobacterium sp. FBM7-1]
MKRSTLFLTIAMIFVALSFTVKAKAQSDPNGVRVFLTYESYWGYYFVGFDVELFNKDIYENYHFQTLSPQANDPNTYSLGRVPPGNYYIAIRLMPSNLIPHYGLNFNWWADDQSGSNVNLNSPYSTVLTEHIVIDDVNDPALHIYLEDY